MGNLVGHTFRMIFVVTAILLFNQYTGKRSFPRMLSNLSELQTRKSSRHQKRSRKSIISTKSYLITANRSIFVAFTLRTWRKSNLTTKEIGSWRTFTRRSTKKKVEVIFGLDFQIRRQVTTSNGSMEAPWPTRIGTTARRTAKRRAVG